MFESIINPIKFFLLGYTSYYCNNNNCKKFLGYDTFHYSNENFYCSKKCFNINNIDTMNKMV